MARSLDALLGKVGVEPDRLADLVSHRVERTEGGHGLLEDEGDARAADGAHESAVGVEGGDIDLSAVGQTPKDLSFFDTPRLVDDVEDRSTDGALTAAALTDYAEGFALFDFEVDAVDRPHDAFVGGVVDLQIVDLNYRVFR